MDVAILVLNILNTVMLAVILSLRFVRAEEPKTIVETVYRRNRRRAEAPTWKSKTVIAPAVQTCNHDVPQGTPTRCAVMDGKQTLFYKCPVCRKEYPVSGGVVRV